MGLFKRAVDVIRSNINDLISKAEDPEKMLNLIIQDMKEHFNKAKQDVAVAIADEKRLKAQYENAVREAQKWQEKAVLALKNGREDLAREALMRKNEQQQLAQGFKEQWEKQKQMVDALKNQLRQLKMKIEEAERKKNLLIARQKRAEAQKRIQSVMANISDTSAFDTFSRMAEKVEKMEAEAEATAELNAEISGTSLEDEFAALEAGSSVDDELAALKAQLGGGEGSQ